MMMVYVSERSSYSKESASNNEATRRTSLSSSLSLSPPVIPFNELAVKRAGHNRITARKRRRSSSHFSSTLKSGGHVPRCYPPSLAVLLMSLLGLVVVLLPSPTHGFQLLLAPSLPRRNVARLSPSQVQCPSCTLFDSLDRDLTYQWYQSMLYATQPAQLEPSLGGIDAQMLELLSEDYLYPEPPKTPRRANGRPDCVPGAMRNDTLKKFKERQEIASFAKKLKQNGKNKPIDEQQKQVLVSLLAKAKAEDIKNEPDEPTTKFTRKPTESSAKGSAVDASTSLSDFLLDTTARTTKGKTSVSENLFGSSASPSTENQNNPRRRKSKGRINKTSADLQIFYRTDLLKPEEEYSLGMKIKFMVQCENIHEGLALKLDRLPTLDEWATACGFEEPDPNFVAKEADDDIRPAGWKTRFDKVNPDAFVGRGLVRESGPGRGRGRVKKPPPTKLGDFYDDTELRTEMPNKTITASLCKKLLKPINRGTTADFIKLITISREAKQRMVGCNMRLVISIARKYSRVGVGLQDLVQEGSLGLSKAAEKYDPAKGFRFSTYASWWIQQAVFRAIAYHSRTIRLPVHVHNLLSKIRKTKKELAMSLGRQPTNDEMADSLGMDPEKYNKMIYLTKRCISLELPKYKCNPKDLGHESDDKIGDTISGSDAFIDDASPQKRVDQGLLRDDLLEMVRRLDDDERKVICSRYGLADGMTKTVTAVAAQLKQSKAWVRSHECKALRKLRRPWYEKKLREHEQALND